MTDPTLAPFTFTCTTSDTPASARRHKVLAGDGICVLCGARGVIDGRLLPPPPDTRAAEPTQLEL